MTSALQHSASGHVLRERLAVHGERVAVQQRQELLQHDGQAARVEEVLHQVLAGGRTFARKRRRARELVEARERQRHAGAAGDGDQVDDGVRRAADGHVGADRVVERLAR